MNPGEAVVLVEHSPQWREHFEEERKALVGAFAQGAARFHLHAVEIGGRFWGDHLAFRDILCRERRIAAEYEALKRNLAECFTHDRAAYTDAKSSFIQSVLRRKCPASAS